MIFAGVTSIDQVTDTTLRLNWTPNVDAVSYNVYSVPSGTEVFLTTVSGQSSAYYTVSGLAPGTLYKFKVRAVDSSSKIDSNIITASATTTNITPAPTGLTLISPATASNVLDTPTINITGVKSGDSVKLFTNNTCSSQIASGTASGTTINLTTSSLTTGAYNFYATTGSSPCSTATVSYSRLACSGGYVLSNGACILLFAGITSIDQNTDTTLRLNWTAHASAVAYNIYYISSGSPTFLTTVSGQSTSSYISTGLTSGTLYQFRIRAVDSSSTTDLNTVSLSGSTTSLTPAPTSLTLITPGTASDVLDTPTVRVSGVKSGDNVKLFTNNTCSTQVASGTASSTTIDLTTSSLTVGANNFYATTGTSTCSTATLAYTRVACSAGYVLTGGVCVLSFAGITSIDQITDTTMRLNWTAHGSAVSYNVYYIISGSPTFLTTVSGQSSSSYIVGGLTAGTLYRFRVRAVDVSASIDSNTASLPATTTSTTPPPTSLTLITPGTASDVLDTPTVRVSGIKSGDNVKLFTNNTCSTQVASGTASSTTIDLTTSSLSVGANNFYATTGTSTCSTATLAYTRVACSAGYVLTSGACVLSFAGITSISNTTDSTLTLNWTSHTSAIAYQVYRMVSGSPSYLTTVSAPASSVNMSGFAPSTTYIIRVRALDSTGASDLNTATQTITTNAAPTTPSGLSLINPATSPDFISTPTIRVSGVKSGDTVKLFTNNTCTTLVATAVASGASIDLTTSVLTAGAYNFYATATNSIPNSSTCSSATVAYTLNACPAGYILVPANATLGVSNFCVMQFGAKNVASVATSQAALQPWTLITQTAAKTACTSLGATYDLISNPEYMTIAQNAENVAGNWSSGIVGTGMIPRGHSDNVNVNRGFGTAAALDVVNTADPYDGTGNTSAQAAGSGWEQKRTLTLSNGNIIWDISGNVWEWVDWSMAAGLQAPPTTCAAAWAELPAVSCGALAAADYLPSHTAYNSSQGMGQFYGGAGGAALRGGSWGSGTSDGAFTLFLADAPSTASADIGFRCVYRP